MDEIADVRVIRIYPEFAHVHETDRSGFARLVNHDRRFYNPVSEWVGILRDGKAARVVWCRTYENEIHAYEMELF